MGGRRGPVWNTLQTRSTSHMGGRCSRVISRNKLMQVVVKSEVNMGIMEAWRNAWSWKEGELFIVIEDDVEMSPHWYKVLTCSKADKCSNVYIWNKSGIGP